MREKRNFCKCCCQRTIYSFWHSIRMEKGRVPLNSTLKKIANYFDVPIDFLIEKENMFWKNYLKLCKDKGLSPNAVAKGLNVSSGSVTEWKKGRIPSKKTLQKLATCYCNLRKSSSCPIAFFGNICYNSKVVSLLMYF